MTPSVLVVGFCATMTVIAIGRLAVDDERSPIDVGTALVVLGITLLSALWIALEEAWLSLPGRILLSIAGLAAVGTGAVVINRHWETATDAERSPTRQGDDNEADGGGDRA
ncbi:MULTISPECIES: hypothetical protein [Natrialbaceae]|uniref:hypothetical protein n=1 Tax=Natrialbaceae TaxID=1644061 RepID=UPI00207D4B94|nr:hypothetical protein [Natronococcus sp. CG52]